MRKNINGNMGVNDFVIREREMNKRLKSKGKKKIKRNVWCWYGYR